MRLVDEGPGPRLDLEVLGREVVHGGPPASLTDGSVYVSVGAVESGSSLGGSTADVVGVGGGTVGAWCAYFLRRSGAGRVVLIDQSTLGQGASSRAAGIVRSQGGTPTAVHLAEWSRAFYLSQHDELGIDSGFVRQGYFIPAFTDAEEATARGRMAMQQGLGLAVRWIDSDEADRLNPTMTPGVTRGGTFLAEDGYIHPPRNVVAYTVALFTAGVEVYEGVCFDGLVVSGDRVTGVETSVGRLSTDRVVLTGGPQLAEVGRTAGCPIPAGGVRHQVAVSEPHSSLDPARLPMVFDLAAGLYWRPEEGGLLFGMSNPDEAPGEATEIDWPYMEQMQARLAELVPVAASLRLRKVWAATIRLHPRPLPPSLRSGAPDGGPACRPAPRWPRPGATA